VRQPGRYPRALAALSRPGDATESGEPHGTGIGGSLPQQRQAPPGQVAGRDTARPSLDTEISDAELLKRHVDGDPDAFGTLFTRHKDRLWAVAVRTMNDPEDAADALQDAMISAFRRAASFRGESAVTTWLHRIVVNACLDRMRRRSARPEVHPGDERLLDAVAAEGADPAEGTATSVEVMKALRQLPHDQQVALVLVDMLDYPVADAAEILGVAEGTVKSRCARGRARLLPRLAYLRQDHAGARTAPGPGTAGSHRDQHAGNRFAPESVLPAQEGGDEEA
jgi:RNA polymerase sigma-70 factor, ECF subfamily